MKLPVALHLALFLTASTLLWTACGSKESNVDVAANIAALKSEDSDAKVNACTELAKAGPDAASATSALIPLLKDKDPLVRRLAAYALGQIGPKASSALPALREALNDSDPHVTSDALIAMRAIGDTNANINMPNVMNAPQ